MRNETPLADVNAGDATGQIASAVDSTNQITVEDFDNAVKQKWTPTTCIIAQHLKRKGVVFVTGFEPVQYAHKSGYEARFGVMRVFDRSFNRPGDETKPELQDLRARLPIELR